MSIGKRQTFFKILILNVKVKSDIWPKGRIESWRKCHITDRANIQFVVNKIPSGCFTLLVLPPPPPVIPISLNTVVEANNGKTTTSQPTNPVLFGRVSLSLYSDTQNPIHFLRSATQTTGPLGRSSLNATCCKL